MRAPLTYAFWWLALSSQVTVSARAVVQKQDHSIQDANCMCFLPCHILHALTRKHSVFKSYLTAANIFDRRAWNPFHEPPVSSGHGSEVPSKDPSYTPGKNPGSTSDHPYDGQSGGSGHPYDGQSSTPASTCKRGSSQDPSCDPLSDTSKQTFADKLEEATQRNPIPEDKVYPSLQDENYNVRFEQNNIIEENSYNLLYPNVQKTIQDDIGIDLGAADTLWTKITKSSEGGKDATFTFYTSASQKSFFVESKFGSNDLNPKTGPLNMRTIQQQALTQALERAGSDVGPGDMTYLGELGITNPDTVNIMKNFRGADATGRVTFDKGSDAFKALSNSDNGRAEFGQLIDNMDSMRLTIDRVDTYFVDDAWILLWHLTKF